MTLGSEVVEFVGSHLAHNTHETHGVRKVSVVQVKMGIAFQMVDAFPFLGGGTSYHAVNVVSFFQKKFSKIGSILSGNAGNECRFHDISKEGRWSAPVPDAEADISAADIVGHILVQRVEVGAFQKMVVAPADIKNFKGPRHDQVSRAFIDRIVISMNMDRLMRLIELGKKRADVLMVLL